MRTDLASRTHCWAGHLYDEANTYWYYGARICRKCRNIKTARVYRERQARKGRTTRPYVPRDPWQGADFGERRDKTRTG